MHVVYRIHDTIALHSFALTMPHAGCRPDSLTHAHALEELADVEPERGGETEDRPKSCRCMCICMYALHSHISFSSYKLITICPRKARAGAMTYKCIPTQPRSP